MSETNKYLGELATQQMVQEIKDGFSPIGHAHTASDVGADQSGSAAAALSLAKEYTNTEVNKVQGTLQANIDSKADEEHSHVVADVTNLQTVLDGKADQSHGTHVTYSSTAPVMDGTANVGSANTVARSDHKHPTDTTRASQADLDALTETLETHTGNSTIHVTSTNKTQWNSAYSHATSAHAPSNAEKNVIIGIQRNGTDLTVNSTTRKVNITVPTTASEVGADSIGSADSALNSAKKHTDEQIANVQADIDGHIDDSSVHITSAERTKLSGIESSAQKNTITGVKGSSETSYRTGDINITPANIGLGNVNNTSDANKPVSTAQQAAIDTVLDSANSYTNEQIALLMNNSSEAIDSIMELATAMENNTNVVDALEEAIGTKANTGHKHTVSHTPTGTVSQPSFAGTKATIETGYKPAGTVSQPTFTGTAATSNAPGGTTPTATVASNTHTHKYTPAGTVSKPTFTGSAVDSGGASDTTTVYSITAVGTLPSHSYTAPSHSYTAPSLSASVANRCLTLSFSAGSHSFNAGSHSFSAGTLPTKGSGVTVATGAHIHTVTPAGSVSQPSFTGTEATTISITGTTSVASSSHTHSVTATGTVSKPTFTGTEATISAEYTPAGTVSQPSFTGTAATLTTSVDKDN